MKTIAIEYKYNFMLAICKNCSITVETSKFIDYGSDFFYLLSHIIFFFIYSIPNLDSYFYFIF